MDKRHEGTSQVLVHSAAWVVGIALLLGYIHSIARLAGLAA